MAYGDIHNHNGTICRARKRRCPLEDGGHSSSVEEYVYHSADEIGVDPTVIQGAIADGASAAEAVKLAKEGLLEIPKDDPKRQRRGGYSGLTGTYRFRRDMNGSDLRQMTRDLLSKIDEKRYGSNSMRQIHVKLADHYGNGVGVPTVSYDPLTEQYSTGKHRSWGYTPEIRSKNLREVVDKAAELYGYEDDEYEVVDAR